MTTIKIVALVILFLYLAYNMRKGVGFFWAYIGMPLFVLYAIQRWSMS